MDEIHVHKTKKSICAHFTESPCSYPPAQCIFCLTNYANANVTPSKLISHFTKRHSEHQNKSKEFFHSHLAAHKKQSNLFDKQMVLQST